MTEPGGISVYSVALKIETALKRKLMQRQPQLAHLIGEPALFKQQHFDVVAARQQAAAEGDQYLFSPAGAARLDRLQDAHALDADEVAGEPLRRNRLQRSVA